MTTTTTTATSATGTGVKNGSPKDLYLCSSWEELEGKVNAEAFQLHAQTNGTVQETMSNLNEMCLHGVLADVGKDEELAYFNYNRYLTAYIIVSQKDQYKTDVTRQELLKIEENVGLIMKSVGILKQSLIRRYEEQRKSQNGANEQKIHRILEQHRNNLDAEIEASRYLKEVREELGSLRMVKQLLEEDFANQQQQPGNPGRVRNAPNWNENVPEQLMCPVCFEVYSGEVMQCRNGHSICATCYNDEKITDCPECRVKFGGQVVRNRALEGLVSTWKMECPNGGQGCKERVLCKEMTKHVEGCFFGQTEEKRQIIKIEGDIKTKEEQAKKCQDKLQEAYKKRTHSEAEWRKLEATRDQNAKILDKVIEDLNLREKEQEVLLKTRLNGFQLSLK